VQEKPGAKARATKRNALHVVMPPLDCRTRLCLAWNVLAIVEKPRTPAQYRLQFISLTFLRLLRKRL
jgi:hypothetical protein